MELLQPGLHACTKMLVVSRMLVVSSTGTHTSVNANTSMANSGTRVPLGDQCDTSSRARERRKCIVKRRHGD